MISRLLIHRRSEDEKDAGKMRPIKPTLFLIMAASISAACTAAVEGDAPATAPPAPDTQVKCSCNPCGCIQSPPPPPPPSPPPPSPKWPVPYCPPPPPAPYLYIVGAPGNLYPFDPQYYPSSARRSHAGPVPVLLVSGMLALLRLIRWL